MDKINSYLGKDFEFKVGMKGDILVNGTRESWQHTAEVTITEIKKGSAFGTYKKDGFGCTHSGRCILIFENNRWWCKEWN